MISQHFYRGSVTDVALVLAGVHGTEVSGVEVVRWLRALLDSLPPNQLPHHTTILAPVLFPDSVAAKSREYQWTGPLTKRVYNVPTNRQFPAPGLSLQSILAGPVYPDGRTPITRDAQCTQVAPNDGGRIPLLRQTADIIRLIELVNPKRIASVHGHLPTNAAFGTDAPGIFVDPRYDYSPPLLLVPPDPVIPTLIDTWGTEHYKFDLTKDPAQPKLGLILLLKEKIQKHQVNAALLGAAQPHLNEGDRLYSEFRMQSTVCPTSAAAKDRFEKAAREYERAATILNITMTVEQFSARLAIGRREDEPLAASIAKAVYRLNPRLLPGNHFDTKGEPQVLHYAASAGHPDGFSLGDWAPVPVTQAGARDGAPVITVEVDNNQDSNAFTRAGQQLVDTGGKPLRRLSQDLARLARRVNKARMKDLLAYAQALKVEFVGIDTT